MSTCRILPGKTLQVLDACPTAAGTSEQHIVLDDSDTVLISLFVNELTAGTLDVEVYTYTKAGEESLIMTFPQISAPTTELVLKKASVAMNNLVVRAVYTGAAKFSIYGKGLALGEASFKLAGAENASAVQSTITPTASLLIPSALTDRASIVIKNNNTSGRAFVGFTLAEAAVGIGYPLSPGEALGIDLSAGQEVYAVAETVDIDMRVLQAGG